ncbi:alpha/beta hydrolase [Actibacterium sp. D379-3]
MSDYFTQTTPGAPGSPLIFTFHGTGGNETQFHGFGQELIPGATVISPRGDVSEAGALRFFRRRAEGNYDMADLAQRVAAMAAFVTTAKTRAQPARTIGLGYSNGANILAAVSFLHPGLFDDLILMHPLIPWPPAPQPGLTGRRVLITAGRRDPICPAPITGALIEYYSEQGAAVTGDWHPGGHEIRDTELTAVREFLAD